MAGELELLTVGRISIDLYCDEIGVGWEAARSFHKAVGGSPTNVAIAVARLGHRAAVYTKVGEDPFGAVARGRLEAMGVEVAYVGAEPGTVTPLAFAVLDPPEDPQLLFRREPPAPDLQLRAGEVPARVVREVEAFWVSASALSQEPSGTTVEAMLRVRARRPLTFLDLDYRPSFWASREQAAARIGAAVVHATVAVGNREECAVAVGSDDPGEAARRLRAAGVDLAVVKLGGEGVLLRDADGERVLAPAPVDVLCGLGAGDAFGGALCHGLLSGWSHDRAVAFANAAGAIVASRLLCSEAMPYRHEVDALLEEVSAA